MSFPVSLIESSKPFQILKHEIDKGRFSPAYMVSGTDAGEVTAFARLAVQYAMCRTLCGRCHNCVSLTGGNHPNVTLLLRDDRILVDDVRALIASAGLKPFEEGDSYYIVSDAGNLNVQAQNKLLKTLEEAPAGIHFFLCTVKPDALLATVKSRVVKLYLAPREPDEVYDAIAPDYRDDADASLAAAYAGGSITNARRILEDPERRAALKYALTLPERLLTSRDVLGYSEGLQKYKSQIVFLLDVYEILFARMIEEYAKKQENEHGFSLLALSHIVDAVLIAKAKLAVNCNPAGVLETLFFTILEVKKKCQP